MFVLMAKTNIYDPESYETSPVKQQIFPFFQSLELADS